MFDTYRECLNALAKDGIKSANPISLSIKEARIQQDLYFAHLNRDAPSVASVRDLSIPGPYGDISVRLSFPFLGKRPQPCIVFLRGAGWWAGGLKTHVRTINSLALLSGFVVCAVNYRRTPEYRYPVQRDEVLETLRWIGVDGQKYGILGDKLIIFGESAGATLGLSVCQNLRDNKRTLPKGLILFYPNSSGPGPAAYSQWVWQNYLGTADPLSVPGPIPILQTLSGLPPTWIGCGADDRLLSDTYALARKLKDSRVECDVTLYEGMPHAFLMYSAFLRPAANALEQAAAAAVKFIDNLEST